MDRERDYPVELLLSKGVALGDVKKIKREGMYSCQDVIKKSVKALSKLDGLTKAKAKRLLEAAEGILHPTEDDDFGEVLDTIKPVPNSCRRVRFEGDASRRADKEEKLDLRHRLILMTDLEDDTE